ncbi:MAG: gamma-glutamyltransferase family protein, partial [Planctomycetia bacterium]
ADLLVAEMKAGDGVITHDDLKEYDAKERPAIHGRFRGYDVYAPPPPSSGGTIILEMLHMVEKLDLPRSDEPQLGRWNPKTVHLLTETMRRAYADRARYLGDADFVGPPPAKLLDPKYAAELAAGIDPKKATPSEDVAKDVALSDGGPSTTHFSVVDGDGMAVSLTTTLENAFGTKIVVRGAGFLLNNEMTDFNLRPGHTDRTGRIGTSPNQIAPGKRMLSSMNPVIVAKNGRPVLVVGSPGGRTIINTTLLVVLNHFEFGMPLRDAVDAPRHHHQWFPDVLRIERSLREKNPELVAGLEAMGHRVENHPGNQGDAHSIRIDDNGGLEGVADDRRSGWAAGE